MAPSAAISAGRTAASTNSLRTFAPPPCLNSTEREAKHDRQQDVQDSTSGSRRQSTNTVTSLFSSNEEDVASRRAAQEIIEDALREQTGDWRSRTCRFAKLMLVVAVPVVALIAISIFQLGSAIADLHGISSATDNAQEFLQLDALVNGLMLERGTSAALITSGGTNAVARDRLTTLWATNDNAIRALTSWPSGGLTLTMTYSSYIGQSPITSALDLLGRLGISRRGVVNGSMTFDAEIAFYSVIVQALIDWSLTIIIQIDVGHLWPMIVSTALLLQAANSYGLQRAIGSVILGCGGVVADNVSAAVTAPASSSDVTVRFVSNGGAADSLRHAAFILRPDVGRRYDEQFIGSSLQINLTTMIQSITSNSVNCHSITDVMQRNGRVIFWQVYTSTISVFYDRQVSRFKRRVLIWMMCNI